MKKVTSFVVTFFCGQSCEQANVRLNCSNLYSFHNPTTADPQMENLTKIAHNVFFTLKDKSPEASEKMVAACHEYLSGHPGCIFFAAGVLTDELNRPVNDRDFQVALHVVFDSLDSQNAYQVAPRHQQFIDENKDSWESVRVFDSTVAT